MAWLAQDVDAVLVVGDRTSSNSRHLRDAAAATGTPAWLIGSVAEINASWLTDARVVGVSAGASTPEPVIAEVVEHLSSNGAVLDERVFLEERTAFRLPREVEGSPLRRA